MTNKLAFIIGLILLGLIGADIFLNDSANLVFLARKFLELLTWIAFWR